MDPIVCAQWRPDVCESVSRRKEKEKEKDGEVISKEKKSEEEKEKEEKGGGGEAEKGDKEGKDESDMSPSSSSFTSKSPLLAFCTGTGRLYFWSQKEGKVEGETRWSDTSPPLSSSTSLSTSIDTSMISLAVPSGNLSGGVNNQKTMSTYYFCISCSFPSYFFYFVLLYSIFFYSIDVL